MTLTAATWGTIGILRSVKILLPNEAIIARIQESLDPTPEHMANLQDALTMELASQVFTDFITSCTASFTDATHPPTWEAISPLWRSEGHIARRHLRKKLGENEELSTAFANSIGPAFRKLQEGAALKQMLADLPAEMQKMRDQMSEQQQLLASMQAAGATLPTMQQGMSAGQPQNASPQQQMAAQMAQMHQSMAAGNLAGGGLGEPQVTSASLLALMQALQGNRTVGDGADFPIDVRTWGPLLARYGSWPEVKKRLYRALRIVPNAVKPPTLENAFSEFDSWYDMMFSRWETTDQLTHPSNIDVVEAINATLRRLIIAAKQQQGLHLTADLARVNAAADPLDLALQQSRRWCRQGCPVNRRAERAPNAIGQAAGDTQPTGLGGYRGRRERRRRVHRQHVERHHMGPDAQSLGQDELVLRGVQSVQVRNELYHVHPLAAGDGINEAHLRAAVHQRAPENGLAVSSARAVRLRPPLYRRPLPTDAGSAANDNGPASDVPESRPLNRNPLKLAWKTASRWNDVSRLTAASVLLNTPDEAVLYCGSETKSSRQNPFRPDLFVVVKGSWKAEVAAYLRGRMAVAGKGVPLFPVTTDAIAEVLRPYGFRAHSIKRGAIENLFQVLPTGDPRMTLIPLLAKHGPSAGPLRELTIRYVSDQVAMARHLGTGLLTALL